MKTAPPITIARKRQQNGFTLLELLVVVSIMATVAGAMIYSAGNTTKTSRQTLAATEMQRIKQALLRFRMDTGHFPSPGNPADFSALYTQASEEGWSIDTGRGWRGPYLTRKGEGYTDIGDDLDSTGNGDPSDGSTTWSENTQGVADPFPAFPVLIAPGYSRCKEDAPNDLCLLDWRSLPDDGDNDDEDGDKAFPQHGRPYLLFDLNDPDKARLISMGPNGRYDSAACASSCDQCTPTSDDILLCLTR